MNKRSRKKTARIKNQKRYQVLFDQIERHYKIKTKKFGNGYFVFDMGEHSVCHFELKETPDWLYGIWFNDEKDFEIFGEHKNLIDKFKPSKTYVSCGNDIEKFIAKIKDIRYFPKDCFVESMNFGSIEDWQLSDNQTRREFIDQEWNEYWNEQEEEKAQKLQEWKFAFEFFKNLLNTDDRINLVAIEDRNVGSYWSTSPRFLIHLVANISSREEGDSLFDKVEELVDQKEKEMSEKFKYLNYRFRFQFLTSDEKDIKAYHYKYRKKEVF